MSGVTYLGVGSLILGNQWNVFYWQRAAAREYLGMRKKDAAPSALPSATPDKLKSLLFRKPLLAQDCIKEVTDFHMA